MIATTEAGRAMALICWLDTFERIDNLLLEIRHVQETIASELRILTFYNIFQFEDRYLWGRFATGASERMAGARRGHASSDWCDILTSRKLLPLAQGCTALAGLWCPEFPDPKEKGVYITDLLAARDAERYDEWCDADGHRRLAEELHDLVQRLGSENRFSANDERLYGALRHLQLLKRDILRDKLVLAYRAIEAFGPRPKTNRADPIAVFLTVRRAALASVYRRLAAFRDIRSMVQETLNLSMEQDPPPTVLRRRDQGIYTTDLADNCEYIEKDVRSYLGFVGAELPTDVKNIRARGLKFIVHRYTQYHTSTFRYDDIWSGSVENRRVPNISAGFVQSSFWMPERPDLQPIIAHEIAHLVIRQASGDFEPIPLDGMGDPLAEVLREMTHAMEVSADKFRWYDFDPRSRETLVREIACDLVAVAVHGTAYLFAQFLELIGVGLENLFVPPSKDIAEDIAELGRENISHVRKHLPEWIIRISVPLAFSNALRRKDRHRARYLETIVHDGIENVIKIARDQLSAWMKDEQLWDWNTWLDLTDELANAAESVVLVTETARWNEARRKQASRREADILHRGPMNRYAPPLGPSTVSHCIGAWLDRLVEHPRILATRLAKQHPLPHTVDREVVIALFRELYLGHPKPRIPALGRLPSRRKPEAGLFAHLIDIPWQTAVLTTHDFLGVPASKVEGLLLGRWITGMHEFNWLGRDLFHTALEYVIWYERRPIGRLKAMNRWLRSIADAIEAVSDSSRDVLQPFETLLTRILDGCDPAGGIVANEASKASQLAKSFDEWIEPPVRIVEREAVGRTVIAVGSQCVCDFHVSDEARGRALPRQQNEAIDTPNLSDFLDQVATAQMDEACRLLDVELRRFFESKELGPPIESLARQLNRPTTKGGVSQGNAKRADLQLGRILLELSRVTHYLDIRPDRAGHERRTRHHGIPGQDWESVFANYLDVPLHARKREAVADSHYIAGLVPTRSIRVDRYSQLFAVHMSSRVKTDEERRRDPGHLPADNVVDGRPLFWLPWNAHGVRPETNDTGEMFGSLLSTPLLGRFDRFTLDIGKHTARSGQFAPRTPHFRRQQIGVPFAAALKDGKIQSIRKHRNLPVMLQTLKQDDILVRPAAVPLATISILLVQRSARLTFVERLLAEDHVLKSFHPSLSSPYQHFDSSFDVGLLTDGWGDLFLVLFGAVAQEEAISFEAYVEQCQSVGSRFDQVITLRKSIFEDTLVSRSETSYTPLAIDIALLNPNAFRCTISIRFRATRDGRWLADEFEQYLADWMNGNLEIGLPGRPTAKLSEILSFARISGRTDYVISTKEVDDERLPAALYGALCKNCVKFDTYGIIFETLRGEMFKPSFIANHVDTTHTSIAELDFPRH